MDVDTIYSYHLKGKKDITFSEPHMNDMTPNRSVSFKTPFSDREIVTRIYYHHRTKVKIGVNVAGITIRAIRVVVLRYSLVTF